MAKTHPLLLCVLLVLNGCYSMRGSSGGGEVRFAPPRPIVATDIALPDGYEIEAVATGLTFPTGVAFDEAGRIYVTESGYAYGEVFTTPRLLRIDPGEPTEIARGSDGPWNGVSFHDGAFFVAEGGQMDGGRILRITLEGEVNPLVSDLPSIGDHHTNGPAIGPDGLVYFGQGTATNSAIVGVDNADFGWLHRHPNFHDIPCRDVALTGLNVTTSNPLTREGNDQAITGAYVPFGTSTTAGQIIPGAVPCSGAVLRVSPGGGAPELVAWGFRNPFGLAFAPDGRLFVTDNSYDDRGSRPVWGTGDLLWEVTPGTWYGFPDFAGGVPLDGGTFKPPGEPAPSFLLTDWPNDPPHATALLGVHSSSSGFDFSRSGAFGYEGDAFIAQFGDMAPGVGKVLAPVGFRIVRVDVETGIVEGFASNKGSKVGPASRIGGGGFERPVSVRFSNDGDALYVVDFGVMTTGDDGPVPHPNTGVLWRITHGGSR